LRILSLDFKHAFDRVSNQHLYDILPRYGFSPWFINWIKAMHDDATAGIQLNGTTVGKISIQRAVRQGCPLSMALYAFCIHLFLRMLNDNIRGYKFGRRHQNIRVTAYVDDATVFLTDPRVFETIRQAILCFEAASAARVNTNKSCAVAIGTWDTSLTAMNIPYREHTTILGFHTAKTVREAAEGS
jgi:hypothetical protein